MPYAHSTAIINNASCPGAWHIVKIIKNGQIIYDVSTNESIIRSIGLLASKGMKKTDIEILKIMIEED